MAVYFSELELNGESLRPTHENISESVQNAVDASGIRNGICVVYAPHTTCSIVIQECSHDRNLSGVEYLQQDFVDVMERIVPTCRREGQYLHPGPEHIAFAENTLGERGEYSLNTDAHLRSAIVGRSESIPVKDGTLRLGAFGQIYFIDWDQLRPRRRRCEIQIIGE